MAKDTPSTSTATPAPAPPLWHASLPAPQHAAPLISRDVVLPFSPEDLLIDVRRTDYEGGTIKGSLNMPAQSFYMNRAVLHRLCAKSGIKNVIFYCGSSNGRGPRCAAWFADYLAEIGDNSMNSQTLAGGIKGWVKAGGEFVKNVDGYEAKYWKQFENEK
ncbi:Rhodanese-like protein [Lepidopterella palustris CBS 459.81]|uniref:Rhodanese-like protein n=1 Tax=Lepidopterella palustris CBS 459.81 TaxID=1314670 RepID=A0A8E2ECC3_9PEZI|nr:Rhodanese-like protein [Lepidopterella palustris CBS 459.81]